MKKEAKYFRTRIGQLSKEDAVKELEAILARDANFKTIEKGMDILAYAKDNAYWNFPNGKSLGKYEGLMFDKAMKMYKK